MTTSARLLSLIFATSLLPACQKAATDTATSSSASSGSTSSSTKYLYMATGSCYSGNGNTTFTNTTASNLVFRINATTGIRDTVIADYNASPSSPGDSPISIVNWDTDHLGVLVENTTTASLRRIEVVEKKLAGSRITLSANTTALSAQLRRMVKLADNSMLISKSTAIEKITASNIRLQSGANPWVSAPGGSCATSTTLISDMIALPNTGKIIFAHAAASQARIGMISSTGYSVAGDCLAAVTAPNASAFPVAMAYDSASSTLFVAYGGNAMTDNLNSIYAYTVNESAGTISAGTEIYDSFEYGSTYSYLLYGISSMYFDPATSQLYVATAVSNATTVANYAVEKLIFDSTKVAADRTHALTKATIAPFYSYGHDTKCITSMFIGE